MKRLSRQNNRHMHSSKGNSVISRKNASRPLLLRSMRLRNRNMEVRKGEACDDDGAPDVPMEPNFGGSGAGW